MGPGVAAMTAAAASGVGPHRHSVVTQSYVEPVVCVCGGGGGGGGRVIHMCGGTALLNAHAHMPRFYSNRYTCKHIVRGLDAGRTLFLCAGKLSLSFVARDV